MGRTIVILSVSHDPTLLSTRHMLLQSAGYIVESASSVERAIRSLRNGDFDLVVLCHSLPEEERARLMRGIRARGSSTPVVFVAAGSGPDRDRLASVSSGSTPVELLHSVEAALQQERAPETR